MTTRREIVTAVKNGLENMTTNGYSYNKVTYWQDTDTQYEKNHLDYRDTTTEYTKKNRLYRVELSVEIQSVLFENSTERAANLGTLAIEDLIKVVNCLSLPLRSFAEVKRDRKWVETKGKSISHIELELMVVYEFAI